MGVIAAGVIATIALAVPAGGGGQPVTTDPDPTAAFIDAGFNGTDPTRVLVCFDQTVGTVENPPVGTAPDAGVVLVGHDEDQVSGNATVAAAANDSRCGGDNRGVRYTFAAGTNVNAYSIVEVGADIVTGFGVGGGSNRPGGLALQSGNTPGTETAVIPGSGNVSGPNLRGVDISGGGANPPEVQYCFAKRVANAGGATGANYGFYRASGEKIIGNAGAPTAPGGQCVTVQFAAGTSINGVRYFVEAGQVVPAGGLRNDANVLNVSGPSLGTAPPAPSPGATGSRPDLLSATRVTASETSANIQIDFKYDANVQTNNMGACSAVFSDGQTLTANNISSVADPTVIRASFPTGIERAGIEIVGVGDNGDAGAGAAGTGGCALLQGGTVAPGDNDSSDAYVGVIQSQTAPGFGSGPDLTACSVDGPNGRVLFIFDELLNPTQTAATANLGIINQSGGATVRPTSVSQNNNNVVDTQFAPGALNNAAACTVAFDAVQDRQPNGAMGEQNTLNTVSINTAPTPPPTGSSTGGTGSGTGTGSTGTGTGTGSTGTGTGSTGTGSTGTGSTGTGSTGTGTGSTGTGTGTTGPDPNVRPQPVFTSRIASARQPRRGRNRNRVVVRVTGRLVNRQGRACTGRVAVGVRTGGRRGRRTFQLNGRCQYSVTFRFRVNRLKRSVRRRGRRLLVRANSSYKGSGALQGDRAPSVLRRVIR